MAAKGLPAGAATARKLALTASHAPLPGGRSYWLGGITGGATPRPLVIGLHGSGQTADSCNAQFWTGSTDGWIGHAASAGYTLALGEGVANNWNPGGTWPSSGQDDIAYLRSLVTDAALRTPIDLTQVYIAGFSAGGAMAWTALCTDPLLFTAGGSASGWAAQYPTQPVDYWHIHGTGDTTVPIRGGVAFKGVNYPAAVVEATRAPRGSRCVLYPTDGGHAVPGWMASQLWAFWTIDRLRP